MAVGNAIASQIVNGDYDLVLTSSTPSMQAVANANREGRVRHVFGIVADPFVAGIGLDHANPMKHPKHMVGQSTFLPVNDVFRLVKESLPGLRVVGTAWNPAEANSRAFVMAARETVARWALRCSRRTLTARPQWSRPSTPSSPVGRRRSGFPATTS